MSELVHKWNGHTFPAKICGGAYMYILLKCDWTSRQFQKITPKLLNCAVRVTLFCGQNLPVSCNTVRLDVCFGHASGPVIVFLRCRLCLTVETPHFLWRYMIISFHSACVRCQFYMFCNIVKLPAIAFLLEIGTRLESDFSSIFVWYRARTP